MDCMTVARFSDWSRRSVVVTAVVAVATAPSNRLAAQEPRPLELRSWLAQRLATPPLSLSGDLTSCTLVRCNQTASFFASTPVPFDVGLTAGLRMRDLGAARLGGQSALGSLYLDRSLGPLSVWSGMNLGHVAFDEAVAPDPGPGVESGLSLRWRRVGVALSIAGGWLRAQGIGNRIAYATPVIRNYEDSLGLHSDTIYTTAGDSTGTASNRWSSTEARITWREERWWITARAGRVASTRQSAAMWAGVQAGAELSHGVTLLFGAAKSSSALAYSGDRGASPHVSLGFGFNTALLSPRGETHRDSSESTDVSRPFTISDLGAGRYRIAVRLAAARSVDVACDCDGWTPMTMTRAGEVWLVDVHARPGVHHVSIRVNGGGWIAPPGLAPVDDDFAGQAGLLVVP